MIKKELNKNWYLPKTVVVSGFQENTVMLRYYYYFCTHNSRVMNAF